VNAMVELIRQVVRQELALHRGPLLATVSAVHTHAEETDTVNYEADLALKHDGLELKNVPIAVSHAGVAAPPRVGDLVLVQFLDHDVQQPFVTGRFYHEDDRPPLYKEDEVLFEHRLPDGTLNHLRFAADGTIFLQRDVDVPDAENHTDFLAGVKIAPDGVIELKTGDDVAITLTDSDIVIKSDGLPITIECDELTVNGKLTVRDLAHLKNELKVGTGTGVKIAGTEITGGPL
jgi:hypothetical protein